MKVRWRMIGLLTAGAAVALAVGVGGAAGVRSALPIAAMSPALIMRLRTRMFHMRFWSNPMARWAGRSLRSTRYADPLTAGTRFWNIACHRFHAVSGRMSAFEFRRSATRRSCGAAAMYTSERQT